MRAGTGLPVKGPLAAKSGSVCLYGSGVASRAWGSSVFRPVVSMKYQASLSQYAAGARDLLALSRVRDFRLAAFEGKGKSETGRYHHPAALVRIAHAAPAIHDAVQAFADIVGAVVIMEGDDSW